MRRLKELVLAPSLLLAAAGVFGIVGCGSSASQPAQVQQVLETVFTSTDPSLCFDLVTPKFLQSTYGDPPSEATRKCEVSQRQGTGTADRIKIENLTVDGNHATSLLHVEGGALNGRTAEAALVKTDNWRIDALRLSQPTPSPEQTRKIVDDALREGLTGQGYTKKQADCVITYLRAHASDAQLAQDLKTLKSGKLPDDFAAAMTACKK